MRYLVLMFHVSAGIPIKHYVHVGIFRWKWWARFAGWVFSLFRDGKIEVWPIPIVWSKRPCFDCICEAKAQGFATPSREAVVSTSIRLVIDPDAPGLVEQKNVQSLMTPELCNALVAELLEAKFALEQIGRIITDKGFQRAAWLEFQKRGLVPMWKPPCSTCGSNCGQCGSSHCGICGAKGGFPHNVACDPLMHAAHEATKCEKCGGYDFHTCSDGKNVGEEYSAKKRYVWQEQDVLGQVVNP